MTRSTPDDIALAFELGRATERWAIMRTPLNQLMATLAHLDQPPEPMDAEVVAAVVRLTRRLGVDADQVADTRDVTTGSTTRTARQRRCTPRGHLRRVK